MMIDMKRRHQDNLKLEIYHQFRLKFDDAPYALSSEYKVGKCRFDLILYEKITGKILCLIEVRRIGTRREVKGTSKKHIKYSSFGLPLFYISQYENIAGLLVGFERVYENFKKN